MASVHNLSSDQLREHLSGAGLRIRVGPYVYKVRSNLPEVAAGIETLYGDFPLASDGEYVDYDIALKYSGPVQRLSRKAEFLFDETRPFELIPGDQAYAFLEWGMNWCVSIHANEYLKLHAAAVAREDSVIVMPGVPGAGKSTLCAALGLSDWRILSDEHAMIEPDSRGIVPLCRPVSLKNESIDTIRSFSSHAVLGPISKETHKGKVAHMKADQHPGSHEGQSLAPTVMLFPRYARDEPQQLSTRRRTDSFILAAYHSFNYSLLGDMGFELMRGMIDSVSCYDLVYHDLDWAVQQVNHLAQEGGGR